MLSKIDETEAFNNLHKFYLDFVSDAKKDFLLEETDEEKIQWYNSLDLEEKNHIENLLCQEAKLVVKEYRGVI